jgi:hypothetical protein
MQKLMALKMHKSDIDTYISTFENLVREAGYNCNAKGTVHLFAQGLCPNLLRTLVYLPAIPVTIDQWQDKAQEEVKNNATRETILQPDKHHYKWQYSDNNGRHKSRCHPNDQTVPIDVDLPVFTQVNRAYIKANKAYTDNDKKTHCTYGKCFNCSRQGHMVKDCPLKRKQQFPQSSYKPSHSNWCTTPQSVPRKYNQPRQQK